MPRRRVLRLAATVLAAALLVVSRAPAAAAHELLWDCPNDIGIELHTCYSSEVTPCIALDPWEVCSSIYGETCIESHWVIADCVSATIECPFDNYEFYCVMQYSG